MSGKLMMTTMLSVSKSQKYQTHLSIYSHLCTVCLLRCILYDAKFWVSGQLILDVTSLLLPSWFLQDTLSPIRPTVSSSTEAVQKKQIY